MVSKTRKVLYKNSQLTIMDAGFKTNVTLYETVVIYIYNKIHTIELIST